VQANKRGARRDFGFDDDQHVFLCVQNLAKVHPDFDSLLGAILRSDDAAVVVFIEDLGKYCAARLAERLRRSVADVYHRIRFVPPQPRTEYLSLLAGSDVVLDTVHYGGGMTTFDAISQGRPIVTLPGVSQRSQFAAACYRQMGFDDCVAASVEDYVKIANRLGTDPDCLAAMETRIAQCRGSLFDEDRVVRSYEETFTAFLADEGRSA
jgi:predicted O-linked N-acetylglucosamine transferase (SPINDLY family)